MLSQQHLRSRLSGSIRLRPGPALNPWCSIPSAHTVQAPTSPLGYRMVATSEGGGRPKRRPKISPTFTLRTLCPERLEAVGQEVVDLSGKVRPRVPTLVNGRELLCDYKYEIDTRRKRPVPYPEGTCGVFYYHRPTKGFELAAGVRFRICDSAAEFAHGRDLLGTRGEVWGGKVLQLVKHKELKGFLALCRAERLIDDALVADIEKLDISRRVSQYQYRLSDPFSLDLAERKLFLMYVTRAKMVRLVFPQYAFLAATGVSFFPLTGSIKAQFELSNLPEHEELGPTLVIRVLDIVNPIVKHPHYDGVAPVLVTGTLLQRVWYGQLRVVAIPLQRQPMAQDLIALAKTTWP